MLFFYSARNKEDQLIRGAVEAVSADAARQALMEMGLRAEELHEATLQEQRAAVEGTMDFPDTSRTPNLVLEGESEMQKMQPSPPPKTEEAQEKRRKKRTHSPKRRRKKYYPFIDTLRLYAGWLLAWYCIVYILGGYQYTRNLPFRIPYVEALLPPFSPVVLSFTLAAFLFLLCTSIHRILGAGKLSGVVLSVLGLTAFALYRLNV